MSSWFPTINSSILFMTHVLGWECQSEQEVVFEMNGFGIVYTLDIGSDQSLPSKIHSIFSSSDKITKLWQSLHFYLCTCGNIPSPSCTPHNVPNCLFGRLWTIHLYNHLDYVLNSTGMLLVEPEFANMYYYYKKPVFYVMFSWF